MKITAESNRDDNGKLNNRRTKFVTIEDKSKEYVEEMIERFEELDYNCHFCPEDNRYLGGTYSDCLTIANDEYKDFYNDYKRLKKNLKRS